jgi:hypothetical protein
VAGDGPGRPSGRGSDPDDDTNIGPNTPHSTAPIPSTKRPIISAGVLSWHGLVSLARHHSGFLPACAYAYGLVRSVRDGEQDAAPVVGIDLLVGGRGLLQR